eukprot:Gb_23375 [translate_table: standard]
MHSMEALGWMSFVAAIWVQAINGTNFDFSAYSSVLKEVLGISQVQLNNLAVASDLGKALGWLSGLASLYLPLWAVLSVAGLLGSIGYGVQWLVLAHKIHALAYWQVYILCILAGNSVCWFNTVSYVICIRNFPVDRGFVLGLSTSYVGLSAAVYTSLVNAISPRTKSLYLLLNALVPVAVCVLAAPFLRPLKPAPDTKAEPKKSLSLLIFYAVAIATGVYLLVSNLVPLKGTSPQRLHALIPLLLLLAPMSVPATVFMLDLKRQAAIKRSQVHRDARVLAIDHIEDFFAIELQDREHEDPKADERIRKDSQSFEPGAESLELTMQAELPCTTTHDESTHASPNGAGNSIRAAIGDDHSLKQLLTSIEFWLLFFVYFCGATLGLVFLNNLGQIVESRGFSKASIFVSLSSSSSFFGRLASALPDYLLKTKIRLPRPAWMGILMLPMAAAFFLLLTNTSVSLYIGTAVLGICTGAITSIAISTTSELFGLKNFGVNHNLVVVNIPLGSLLFGYIAGLLYDNQAGHQSPLKSPGSGSYQHRTVCHGTDCYNDTFLIWGSVCCLGLILSLILSIRTRAFYQRLYRSMITN